MAEPTWLIVPGLRDDAPAHWQSHLAANHPAAVALPPLGRTHLSCADRVAQLEAAAHAVAGPIVLVAHSAGCLTVAHWALHTRCPVQAALLATPPDFDTPLPAGYPSLAELDAGGWRPVPRQRLPFAALVLISDDDPLAQPASAAALAGHWGAHTASLGAAGHLNPASGHGPWPEAEAWVAQALALAKPPQGDTPCLVK